MLIRTQTPWLLGLYRIANKTGLLEHDVCFNIFVHTYFLFKRHLEDPFARLARRYPHIFRHGHILDVGANVGYTATVFHEAADPAFIVYAFEAEERNFRALMDTIARHRATERIVPVHAAVGDRNAVVELWINNAHPGDHRIVGPRASLIAEGSSTTTVPMITMDQFLANQDMAEPIAFVKIDVQGYELPVCNGMTATLGRNPQAVVVVEFSPSTMQNAGVNPGELVDFFRARGYRLYAIAKDGRLLAFDDGHTERLLKTGGYVDLLCSRRSL